MSSSSAVSGSHCCPQLGVMRDSQENDAFLHVHKTPSDKVYNSHKSSNQTEEPKMLYPVMNTQRSDLTMERQFAEHVQAKSLSHHSLDFHHTSKGDINIKDKRINNTLDYGKTHNSYLSYFVYFYAFGSLLYFIYAITLTYHKGQLQQEGEIRFLARQAEMLARLEDLETWKIREERRQQQYLQQIVTLTSRHRDLQQDFEALRSSYEELSQQLEDEQDFNDDEGQDRWLQERQNSETGQEINGVLSELQDLEEEVGVDTRQSSRQSGKNNRTRLESPMISDRYNNEVKSTGSHLNSVVDTQSSKKSTADGDETVHPRYKRKASQTSSYQTSSERCVCSKETEELVKEQTRKQIKKEMRKWKVQFDGFSGHFWKIMDYNSHFKTKDGIVKNRHRADHLPESPWAENSMIRYNQTEEVIGVFRNDTPTDLITYNETTGDFTVKVSGIYLLHINMTIVDKSHTHYAALFLNDQAMIACQKGGFRCPRYNDEDKIITNTYRICNVDGTLQLKEGDVVQVRTMEPGMVIRLEEHRPAVIKFILLHEQGNKKRKKKNNNGRRERRRRKERKRRAKE